MSADEMHLVFREWNEGELDSYLIEITRDILDFGKLEAGKINLAEVAFDLRKEVDFQVQNYVGHTSC